MTATTTELFMEAGRMIRRRIEHARVPLPMAQTEAMRCVVERRELTMRSLAQALCITAPSATALVAELVKQGYLKRVSNPADRRQVLLVATAHGAQALDQTLRSRVSVLADTLGHLSAHDHRDLQRILTHMIEANK